MKDARKEITYKGEINTMKKSLIVLSLAVAFVLAMASTAFAFSPGYIDWNASGVNNTGVTASATPHGDYELTTEKCAVCHSVHAAAWSVPGTSSGIGAWAGVPAPGTATPDQNSVGAEQSQVLLRGSIANACSYCHIATTLGGKQIYSGSVTTWQNASNQMTGYGHSSHAACTGCHATHGASTIQGAVTSKDLLNEVAGGAKAKPYQAEYVADKGGNAVIDASGDKYLQETAFCTRCHAGYSNSAEQTITSNAYFDPTGDVANANGIVPSATIRSTNVQYHNHPLVAASASWTGPAGSTYKGKIAWADASACRSCHAAGLTDGAPGYTNNSFPHLTPNNAAFLQASDSAAGALAPVVSTVGTTSTPSESSDGVCLRCHRSGTGLGVGQTF